MVKITLENGTVLEGSVEELRQMGVKLPQQVKPLEVGDYAKVTQKFHRQNGTIVKLKAYERPGSSFPFRSVNLDGSEGDIFDHSGLTRATDEEVAEAKKPAPAETITHEGAEYKRVDREAREGDVVVFDNSDYPKWLIVGGKPYEVVGKSSAGRETFIGEDGDDYHVYNNMCANRTPANVKVYEPIGAKPAPLQVGDYAKVVGRKHGHDFEMGDIVLLEPGSTDNFKAERVIDSETWYVREGELTRATDEEVAEAKRQQAEKAVADKWAEIGRKPNEFKEGDIVRYTGSATTKGSYVEVVKDTGVNGRTSISWGKSRSSEFPRDIELITPVEHRFDKPGGESE